MAKQKAAAPRYRIRGLDESFRFAYHAGRTYDLDALTKADARSLVARELIETIPEPAPVVAPETN